MSAAGIADTVVQAIEKGEFDAIIMNFANADMVGHSGKLEATIRAVETVDQCLGRIFQSLRPRGGAWIITADHGNAETMIDPVTGGPHTYHTTNPVPFILLEEDGPARMQPGGALRDIAPTLLGMLGLPQPVEMTGRDLRIAVEMSDQVSDPLDPRRPADTKLRHLRAIIKLHALASARRTGRARAPALARDARRAPAASRPTRRPSFPIPIFSWVTCCAPSSCGWRARLQWFHSHRRGRCAIDVSRVARIGNRRNQRQRRARHSAWPNTSSG